MSFEVEYKTLEDVDATNKYVSLNGTPAADTNVAMDIITGTAQLLCINGDGTCDFIVDENKIKWDFTSSLLYNLLATGDSLRIIYDKS